MTLPEAQPTTAVRFHRAGVVVTEADVPGHVLELNLPASVTMQRDADGTVHLIESDEPTLECCGQIALPWVSRAGPGTSFLTVPPPAPFTGDDVREMWTARNRLTALRRPPTSGDADWGRLRHAVSSHVDWQALELSLIHI